MNLPLNVVSTVRPGLLVSLKTAIRGNVSYSKQVLDADRRLETGEQKERWETERTITNPDEHDLAKKARGKIGGLFKGACIQSTFGLLCPEDNEAKLVQVIAESRKIAEDFNKSAVVTRLSVDVLCGRITPDDAAAVRAINSEIRDLMSSMQSGIEGADAEAVRSAANRLRGVGEMLSEEAGGKVKSAVETARAAARQILKSEGRDVDRSAIAKIAELSGAFFDFDEPDAVAAPGTEAHELDLDQMEENYEEVT